MFGRERKEKTNMEKFMKSFEKIRGLYEKEYDIRFCRAEEIERVVEFIDTYWQKGHIFTKSRELLDWQHYDRQNDRYNFVIAVHKRTDEIHGVVGFILSSIYDKEITTPIRWGAIWKVREDVGAKGLGMALKWFFQKYAPAPYVGGIGLSHYSKEINSKLGEDVGELQLYYMLNEEMEEYFLVGNYETVIFKDPGIPSKGSFRMIQKEAFTAGEKCYFSQIPPYKSVKYYINRYFEHPIYTYYFTEILDKNGIPAACFVWRFCEAQGHRCIVIVDYLGNGGELLGHYQDFQKLLSDTTSEYISFFNVGMKPENFYEAGFKNRYDSEIIIPVYYEPFLKKNVTLDYHYYAEEGVENWKIMFKGDADQDRPNRLNMGE